MALRSFQSLAYFTFLCLFSLLPHSLALPGFGQLTFTGGYTQTTRELCTTSYSNRAPRSVPTYSFDSTLRPDIVVVIVTTANKATITPPPTITQETIDTVIESTTTLLKRTDTFFSTYTELSTIAETVTSTSFVTSLWTDTTTLTTTIVFPTKSGFVPVVDSVHMTNYSDESIESARTQTHLELRDDTPVDNDGLPFRKSFKDPFGILAASYPAAINCGKYVMPTWTETIAFIRGTSTTTIAPSTSTITITNTVISISTEAPSATTTLTSTTTDFTTTTTTDVEWGIEYGDTTVTAYATATNDVQCGANNLLGSHLSNGEYLYGFDEVTDFDAMFTDGASGYECCMACSITKDCLVTWFLGSGCYHLISKTGCHPGKIVANPATFPEDPGTYVYSNGQCGVWGEIVEGH